MRFDVFQGHLDLHVMVIDEGKKNEVIGDGILLLHEVIDKGELDGKQCNCFEDNQTVDFDNTSVLTHRSRYYSLVSHQVQRISCRGHLL